METITFIELAKLLISFAILAPSGHTSQPWQFQVSDNEIIITPDYTKRLDVVDGNDRELFISLGCAVQNLQTAASHFGYNSNYIYNDGKIIVTITKQDVYNDDTLFDAIKKRHTFRGSFTGEKIPANSIQSIENEGNVSVMVYESECRESEIIKQKITEGNEIQMSDTAFKRELISWMRFNKKQVNETHNGLCYNVLGFPATPKPIGRKIIGMFLNPKHKTKQMTPSTLLLPHSACLVSRKTTIEIGLNSEYF